ncbi:hypothetical protein [Pseudoalteromonas sp.]|uniref:hypothetical protein n=1 Tax=Pseudoalteromonas sp. TaxID=53249 RepID=UPI0026189A3A|nr:hypothetical protein [Pseudoalteromonas sp.]MCP4585297.1 hypothetical protein [Pseudoalteromonas sp.]
MDNEIKKAVGYLLLEIVGLFGILAASMLPTLTLSGPIVIFLIGLSGALGYFAKNIISLLTGVPIPEPLEVNTIDYTSEAFDLDMGDEPEED